VARTINDILPSLGHMASATKHNAFSTATQISVTNTPYILAASSERAKVGRVHVECTPRPSSGGLVPRTPEDSEKRHSSCSTLLSPLLSSSFHSLRDGNETAVRWEYASGSSISSPRAGADPGQVRMYNLCPAQGMIRRMPLSPSVAC